MRGAFLMQKNGKEHFSDRIWMYQELLHEELSGLLQTGLIQGKNARAFSGLMKKRFGRSGFRCGKDGFGGKRTADASPLPLHNRSVGG